MRGRQPGDGHVELVFVQRQGALHNARGHRASNAAPVFAALHHCGDDIFGMIEWRKTSEPGDRVLVAVIGRLGGAGLSGDLPSFQPRCATGPSVLVNNFPKPLAHELDLIWCELIPQIRAHSWRLRHGDFTVLIENWRTVLIQDFIDEAGIVTDTAICGGGVCHRQLQRRDQVVTLPDRYIGSVSLRPSFLRVMHLHPFRAGQNAHLFAGQLRS